MLLKFPLEVGRGFSEEQSGERVGKWTHSAKSRKINVNFF